MKQSLDVKNNLLLELISPKLTSRRRIKILESIQVINSYELIFIFCVIIRYKFSGNLIIVNRHNDLSGIEFISGDIVRIDYPDHENLLGNIIVKAEIISKYEMQEIVTKTNGKKLGQYLVENNHITEKQLIHFLIKQARSRLNKYMNDVDLRMNFHFDGESSEKVIIHHKEYFEALHHWIFEVYKPEWLDIYRNFYSRLNFAIDIPDGMAPEIKKFFLANNFFEILKKSAKKKVTYFDLINMINVPAEDEMRLIHFMVLIGVLVENKVRAAKQGNQISEQFLSAKQAILHRKYFDALGIVNLISSVAVYDEKVHFYFIWIKLHGALYQKNVLDLAKIRREVAVINPLTVGPADYHYVLALLEANLKNDNECRIHYDKAVGFEKAFARFPIAKDPEMASTWSIIKSKIGF